MEESLSLTVKTDTPHFIIVFPPTGSKKPNVLPLGPLYLSEALLREGFDVNIVDGMVDDIIENVKKLVKYRTVALGISSLSGIQLMNAIKIARRLKLDYPNIPVVFGGAHTTALPLQTLENDFVDYVSWGEGEISLPGLLKALWLGRDVSAVKGIGYKDGPECVLTQNSGYTPLDRVFKLPYHLLNTKGYARELIIGPKNDYSIYTSRGCPYACKFCSNTSSVWSNRRMRYHSMEHVVSDITTLINDYDADGITIADENFFVREDRVVEICNIILDKKFNTMVKFRAVGRADLLSRLKKDTWELLKKAGFIGFSVGIESGSQKILDYIGKGITLEQVYRTDELLTEYKFYKTYTFMTCVPGETIDDINKTLKLMLYLARSSKYCPYPFSYMLHKYIPMPGTELFDISIKHGFKPPIGIEGWTCFDSTDVRGTIDNVRPWLSGELLEYVDRANQLIEDMNSVFKGVHSDMEEIEDKISKIIAFVRENGYEL